MVYLPQTFIDPQLQNSVTTCHLFFERPFVALVYHTPVAQIVVQHPQQAVWNLPPHHRINEVLPSRGVERIAYVNANRRTESLTFSNSSSCFSGEVHHCLDGVQCGPAFPKADLVLEKAAFANHVTLYSSVLRE